MIAVLTLAAGWLGCTSEAPAKLECSDPNPCVSAKVVEGKCAKVPLTGPACVVPGTAVAGTCEAGVCASPSCQNMVCDDGNPCTVDTCDPATGKCAVTILPGAACTVAESLLDPECVDAAGVCDISGTCAPIVLVGTVCALPASTQTSGCMEATGTCNSTGHCAPTANPAMIGKACHYNTFCGVGTCDAAGACVIAYPNAGKLCKPNGGCGSKYCTEKGTCELSEPTDGKPCSKNQNGTIYPGTCAGAVCDTGLGCEPPGGSGGNPCKIGKVDTTGACQLVANTGAACNAKWPNTDPCASSAGICNDLAECAPKPDVGKACPIPAGLPSYCAAGICSATGQCQVAPQNTGKECGGDQGCGTKYCTAKGTCEVTTSTDGQPCLHTSYNDPPYVGVCSGGKCGLSTYCNSAKKDLFKNPCIAVSLDPATACATTVKVGAPCTVPKSAKLPCYGDAGVCDAVGLCVPASPDVGAPCTVDECRAGVCAADGSCAFVPKTGSPCSKFWGLDLGPCSSQQCGADGECHIVAKDTSVPCTIASPCRQKAGHCDGVGNGSCTSELLQAGTDCSEYLSVFDRSNTCTAKAFCTADGSCAVQITPGSACSSECTNSGTCATDGTCEGKPYWGPNTSCLTPCGGFGKCQQGDGRCHGTPGLSCSVAGDTCADCICDSAGLPVVKSSKPAGTPCSTSCMDHAQCVHGACMGTPEPGSCGYGPCTEGVCCAEILRMPKAQMPYYASPMSGLNASGCFSWPDSGSKSKGCGSISVNNWKGCSQYSCVGYSAYCNEGSCNWEKAAGSYCSDTSTSSGAKFMPKLSCEYSASCAAPYTYDFSSGGCDVAKFGTWDKATAKPTYSDTAGPMVGCEGPDVTCLHGQCVLK